MRAASASPVTTAPTEAAAHVPATTSAALREGGTRRESENSSRQNDCGQAVWYWH
jgi:hypothetical protein